MGLLEKRRVAVWTLFGVLLAASGASAAPQILSVRFDPDPLEIGGAYEIAVEPNADVIRLTIIADYRPAHVIRERIVPTRSGNVWTAAAAVNPALQSEGQIVFTIVADSASNQRALETRTALVRTPGGGSGPAISIASPASGFQTVEASIDVSGSAGADAASVDVNGVAAALAGGAWQASAVPLAEGSNTLVATARNAAGAAATDSVLVLRDSTPPIVDALAPADGAVVNDRQPIIQHGFSDAGVGVDASTFKLTLNGSDVTFGTTISGDTATYVPQSPLPVGENELIVSVEDLLGNLRTLRTTFVVSVFRAIADCAPTSGAVPLTVSYRTRGEFTGGSIVRYRWDFQGDGAFDTSDSVARDYTFTFNQPGLYNATLEITNNLGETATDVCPITVTGSLPRVEIEAVPSNGEVPLAVTFQGNVFKQGGGVVMVEWDFDGDGVFELVIDNGDFPKPAAIAFFVVHADCGNPSDVEFFLNGDSLGSFPAQTGCFCNGNEVMYLVDDPALFESWEGGGADRLRVAWDSGYYLAYARAQLLSEDGEALDVCLYDHLSGGTCGSRDLCAAYNTTGSSAEVPAFGTLPTSFSADHTYEEQGVFNAVVRITDTDGFTATASATATSVRVGPPGSPTVIAGASPTVGTAPQTINFTGTAVDDGSIALWEWDFEGDGVYDFSSASGPNTSRAFAQAGRFAARLRVTDDEGLSSFDMVDVELGLAATLSIADDTFQPAAGETASVSTSISAPSRVRIVLRNAAGSIVRALVDGVSRAAGSYADSWDGLDGLGRPLPHGPYYAVMEYTVGAETKILDLTATTGGSRYNPSRNSLPSSFRPYEDNHLTINFTVPASQGASEVQAFVGLFNTDIRLVTLLERVPFGVGTHTIRWDGIDAEGNFAVAPPGDRFLFGLWGFTLPNNAIFLDAAPTLSALSVDPNFFNPSTPDFLTPDDPVARISFDLDKPADVELTVTNLSTGGVISRIRASNVPAGAGKQIAWSGRADNGLFADSGDYRLALQAIDASGSRSLVRYLLVRVFH